MLQFTTKADARRLTGLMYISSVSKSVKHKKSLKYGELTLSVYLSPGNTSGYEVCKGRTAECSKLCLNESGMNSFVKNNIGDTINTSRIKKTKLFFEEKDFFMDWLIYEINSAKTKATRMNYSFSVRLNNTSDINPEDFTRNGKNILEIFPDIQFYDYTKISTRMELTKKYKNYDLTYSYTGYNLTTCQEMLLNKIKVAIVFKHIPTEFMGYPVINGDDYDMRYKDKGAMIIGLKYKRVRAKLTENVKFVIQ